MLNVVNPPQKPTVNESFNAGLISDFSINKKYKKPITKHPIIFTKKVAKGKLTCICFAIFTLIKYLVTAPMPPPKNIEIIFSIGRL